MIERTSRRIPFRSGASALHVATFLVAAGSSFARADGLASIDPFAPRSQDVSTLVERVHEIDHSPRTASFPPILAEIVATMDLDAYDLRLRQLSGIELASVGPGAVRFDTRYSLSTAGQLCWQYAFERLEALGYTVSYDTYTRSGHELKNVVATLPGEVTPERIYVLGGHIDSTSEQPSTLAPGAEDNGSGAAAVLAAAESLARYRFESTIELVLFSGEEQGLWGSQAYVSHALSAGRDLRAAVTCDMISYHATDYGVLIEGGSEWASLMQTMADAVDAYTGLAREFSWFSFGSDHVPFQQAGIPAILCIDLDWDEYPFYHRSTDTYDHTDPVFALEIAKAAMATVASLAVPRGVAVQVPTIPPVVAALRIAPNPTRDPVFIHTNAIASRSPAEVFDASGRFVRRLGPPSPGDQAAIFWDLNDELGVPVRAGRYWVRFGAASEPVVVLR